MDNFKKDIQKLELGDLHAEEVKPTDKTGEYSPVLWRCGGCYRCGGCGGCGGCFRCGGCGGCFRCGGCFGCGGCFWW